MTMTDVLRTDWWKTNAKKVGDDVAKTGRSVWLVGLGTVATVDEEARGTLAKLVEKGEKFEKSDRNLVVKAIDQATDTVKKTTNTVEAKVQDAVHAVLHRAGVPTGEEISDLSTRVEKLTKAIERMEAKVKA
jgi:poly(hydroxyalkanoate) granule-associated protein